MIHWKWTCADYWARNDERIALAQASEAKPQSERRR